ncbi:MAG: sugar ABC transporter substrate-binding protein [Solirubrobacterales bacterium]|nr:sugar ABC transporter substrate-binding protein [Solirubrobacterales bacterium]
MKEPDSARVAARRPMAANARRRLGALAAIGAVLAALFVVACGGDDDSGDGGSSGVGPGISGSTELPPFEPSDEVGEKPSLPAIIAYAQDSPRGYQQAIAEGLEAGAKDADLELKIAQSDGDPQRQVQNLQQFLVSGVGSIVTLQVDPNSQAPIQKEAIEKGAAVNTVIFGPSTTQVAAPQYEGGEVMGNLAKDYIEDELGGKANVVILNLDSLEAVRPRFQAVRDVLETVPGAKIVADVEPAKTDSKAAFDTMSTILQKTPQIDVVIGVDATSTGALAALRAAGKDRPDQFIGGFDGEPEALDEIEKGGPFKATITTEPSIMAYAFARYSRDWLDGKTVPQGICVRAVAVTNAEEVRQYRADEANPGPVFEDPERRGEYLSLFGNISYETRDQYINSIWQPKTCP